ncbi:MAG: hypothetical protein RL563_2615 [Pseudomonadota bacterium]|jgi:hypothetical protein
METSKPLINPMMLSQQINQTYLNYKGYDAFNNLHSHDAHSLFDSYLHFNKDIASSLTSQNVQISFISKFNRE